MKRASIAVAVLVALTLTGCAAGQEAPSSDQDKASESAAPLVAESPTDAAPSDAEAAYLAEVRDRLPATTIIPNATDEQLLAAGHKACELRADDPTGDNISLIDGEERNEEGGYYLDSQAIVGVAWTTLCPS